MKFAQRCSLFAFIFLAGAAVAHAQGIVTGVVTDSSGSQPLTPSRTIFAASANLPFEHIIPC